MHLGKWGRLCSCKIRSKPRPTNTAVFQATPKIADKIATIDAMSTTSQQAAFQGKDLFVRPDGSAYHLGTKPGEVAPRIVTVGSRARAQLLSKLFDAPPPIVVHSSRDMTTLTGTYKGFEISIVAIGMGSAMMEFFCREAAYCQQEPLKVIRVGTCGIVNEDIQAGVVCTCSKGSSYCYANYSKFAGGGLNHNVSDDDPYYFLSKPIYPDERLTAKLQDELRKAGVPQLFDGRNVSGETFYAAQGRHSDEWNCHNESILELFKNQNCDWVEMENHHLIHCASLCSRIKATGCAIGVVSRSTDGSNIKAEQLTELELKCGKAAMEALIC